MRRRVQEPDPHRPDVTVDVVRSTESIDFDDWARRLIGYALDRNTPTLEKNSPPTAA